jgi:signal transduction histidine kinase
MVRDVLLIAGLDGLENCARVLEQQVGARVEIAQSRREGLEALRRRDYGVVVVEESLTESDPAWADQVWDHTGFAVPLRVNFAILGAARLAREVKAALARRDGEQSVARKAVASEIEDELKSSLTGLLLQSELALRDPGVTPALEPKLRHMVELSGQIRERLRQKATGAAMGRE